MGEKMGGGEDFLKKKYDLHNAPEVEEQAELAEARTGEKVPRDLASRINNYLARFEDILKRESANPNDPEKKYAPTRESGIEALKRVLYRKNIVKPEDIPEAYFDLQRRLAREQGHGDVELDDERKAQLAEVVIADQKSSLDTWIDYMASSDALYPTWLKYWATRSVLGMGEFDKKNREFTKRSKGTVKPFPDLNREALAYVLDAVQEKYQGGKADLSALDDEDRGKFQDWLKKERFAELYAVAVENFIPASPESLKITEGEWVKYGQGSDPTPLVNTLKGHGTGWCTAGKSTARAQLQGGDLYVYYSLDDKGQPTIPRAAIRQEGDRIVEVRGIAKDQNLDPFIGEVVQKKMAEFPDGKEYAQKAGDMKLLTEIEKKSNADHPLGKDDLVFLYEINGPIQGFGYQKDPRIKELRDKRNPKEDAPIVLECAPEQIAWSQNEVTEKTKAYVGPLFPGVFEFPQLEQLYVAFPEKPVRRFNLEIGGRTPKEYEVALAKDGHEISDLARDILAKVEPSREKEEVGLVRLTVADLGFKKTTRYDEIRKRAAEFGLEPVPAEVGPALRLSMKDQAMNDLVVTAMEPLAVRGGSPFVFGVKRREDGSWLIAGYGNPDYTWRPEFSFVFRRRKP